MNAQQATIGIGVLVVLGVAFYIWKRGIGGVAQDVAGSAVKAAGGAAVGVVKGTSSVLGIPDTDEKKCQKAIADGNWTDASFYCTASEFIAAGGNAFYTWFNPPEKTQ